jgi:hypothetical protein
MDRTSVVKEQGGEKKTAMTVTMNPAGLTEPGAHRFGELAEFYARSRQARSMRSKSSQCSWLWLILREISRFTMMIGVVLAIPGL